MYILFHQNISVLLTLEIVFEMAIVYHAFVKHCIAQWHPICSQDLGANVTHISFLNEIKFNKTVNIYAEKLI